MIARRIFLAITFAATLIVPTAVARPQSGGSEQMETPYPPEIVAKLHPNLKLVDLVAQTGAVVKLARIELLTLVDYVQ